MQAANETMPPQQLDAAHQAIMNRLKAPAISTGNMSRPRPKLTRMR